MDSRKYFSSNQEVICQIYLFNLLSIEIISVKAKLGKVYLVNTKWQVAALSKAWSIIPR